LVPPTALPPPAEPPRPPPAPPVPPFSGAPAVSPPEPASPPEGEPASPPEGEPASPPDEGEPASPPDEGEPASPPDEGELPPPHPPAAAISMAKKQPRGDMRWTLHVSVQPFQEELENCVKLFFAGAVVMLTLVGCKKGAASGCLQAVRLSLSGSRGVRMAGHSPAIGSSSC